MEVYCRAGHLWSTVGIVSAPSSPTNQPDKPNNCVQLLQYSVVLQYGVVQRVIDDQRAQVEQSSVIQERMAAVRDAAVAQVNSLQEVATAVSHHEKDEEIEALQERVEELVEEVEEQASEMQNIYDEVRNCSAKKLFREFSVHEPLRCCSCCKL